MGHYFDWHYISDDTCRMKSTLQQKIQNNNILILLFNAEVFNS